MPAMRPRAAESQLRQNTQRLLCISRMKGHEDDGMFFEKERSPSRSKSGRFLSNP
jgi:hypothetical protein